MRRINPPPLLAVLATAALLVSAAGGTAGAAPGDDPAPTERFTATPVQPDGEPVHAPKSASAQLAQSDPELLARTDGEVVPVMVKLDLDAAASYAGGVEGFAPTSPEVTGLALDENERAVESYLTHAAAVTGEAAEEVTEHVPEAEVTGTYEIAYGGLSALVPANRAKDLLDVPGVVAVQADRPMEIQTDVTPDFIGATEVWPSIGGSPTAGEGVIVGVLDTGIWPEHPSFADPGIDAPEGGPWACEFGDGSHPDLGAPFECNDKLIGAYEFLETNRLVTGDLAGDYCVGNVCSARDDNGHGTHTSSTAAGSPVESAVHLGVDRGPISGIAPGAHVIMYRVCRPSCYQSDSVAAVQQAIVDGVDVINFSIGGGTNPYADPVELAFLDATKAGISVNASAGNEGPGAGTAGHGGPWVTTTAASTSDRHFEAELTLAAGNGQTLTKVGSTVTDGASGPVVHAQDIPGYADALCLTPLPPGSATGKIVVCDRGTNARVDKGYNVREGGAVGMILLNLVTQGVNTDNHFLPAIHLEGPNDDVKAFVRGQAGVTASWGPGAPAQVRGDVMAGFSSRGPIGPVLKPDLTAPGVQVLAGQTPTPRTTESGPPGELFQAIAGTSMASPHAAGSAALLKAAHPDWTPAEIKSALMTTSVQDVLEEDGVTPTDPFDRGAGSLRVNRAARATFVMDVPSEDYEAAAAGLLHSIDLNLPSIQADPLPGTITVERTVRNVSGKTQPVKFVTTADPGVSITVSPKNPVVKAGESLTFSVTIDATAAEPGWRFGQITLDANPAASLDAVIPVAVNVAPSDLVLTHGCDPTSVPRNTTVTCTATLENNSTGDADVTMTLTAPKKVDVSAVSAPAAATSTGWSFTGTVEGAKPPQVTSITSGGSPAGYLPLSLFGIAPVTGVGDESLVNFNIPAFRYGGETYTRVAMDANGYVVIGGGTTADNECCTIPPLPNPARPNNVVAPLWTDLNPDQGGALRAGSLTDGVDTWIVLDWEGVPAWGTSLVNSFQVWIRLGTQEEVTMAYGTVQGAPASYDLQAGAENSDGTSGATVPAAVNALSGTDWTVNTLPPAGGGSVTVTYEASSKQAGTYPLRVDASAPTVRATVSDVVDLLVTK